MLPLQLSQALRFLTVVGSGIPAGSQLLVATHVSPRLRGLESDLGYRMHDALLHHEGHNAVAAAPSAVAAASALTLLITEGVDGARGAFTLLGFVGGVGVVVSTLAVNGPENDRIRGLLDSPDRPEYASTRRRWGRAHAVRASSGVLSFCSYTAASIARGRL